MGIPIFKVDAFAAEPFTGNPAAVCLLGEPRDEIWMQRIAREMNLSETAFLVPQADRFQIRWFTPALEVKLCGHATLASAHILYERGIVPPEQAITFTTIHSGVLQARREEPWLELDFPALPARPVAPPPDLIPALGLEPVYVGQNRDDYLVLAANAQVVRDLQPDFVRLRTLAVRGVIVTAPSDKPGFDFISRFFAPGAGIDEDPVTGSAHCCLGPFWQSRLNKQSLMAYQASSRGGVLRVQVNGDRVRLGGQAVTVLAGELVV